MRARSSGWIAGVVLLSGCGLVYSYDDYALTSSSGAGGASSSSAASGGGSVTASVTGGGATSTSVTTTGTDVTTGSTNTTGAAMTTTSTGGDCGNNCPGYAPDCVNNQCVCAGSGLACDPDEACDEFGCRCGTDLGGAGHVACEGTYPDCDLSAGHCVCNLGSCVNGFVCVAVNDPKDLRCQCDVDAPCDGYSCNAGACSCLNGVCIKDGQTCDVDGFCNCTGGSCEDP